MNYFDPAAPDIAAVYACSPRAGGNSDQAAALVAQGIREAGGQARIIHLRQFRIAPCLGCHRCEFDPQGRCFQAEKDQSGALYQPLLSAPLVLLVSPIYFYHLPSGCKAFIDRSQSYYLRSEQGDPELTALPQRPAGACLIAGRSQGEHLFDGALRTLRYFFKPFRRTLGEPLLLRGLDAPEDLGRSTTVQQSLLAFGAAAWTAARTAVETATSPAQSRDERP